LGFSLLPPVRATWPPKGKIRCCGTGSPGPRLSMSGALAYRADKSEAALVFQITEFLQHRVADRVPVRPPPAVRRREDHPDLGQPALPQVQGDEGLLATQRHWLVVERLPGYAHDLNPIEMVWGNVRQSSSPTSAQTPSTTPTPPPKQACTVSAPATTDASASPPTRVFLYDPSSLNYRRLFNPQPVRRLLTPLPWAVAGWIVVLPGR
jgi:hypothetical protein